MHRQQLANIVAVEGNEVGDLLVPSPPSLAQVRVAHWL